MRLCMCRRTWDYEVLWFTPYFLWPTLTYRQKLKNKNCWKPIPWMAKRRRWRCPIFPGIFTISSQFLLPEAASLLVANWEFGCSKYSYSVKSYEVPFHYISPEPRKWKPVERKKVGTHLGAQFFSDLFLPTFWHLFVVLRRQKYRSLWRKHRNRISRAQ